MENWYLYILYSEKINRYYTGYTNNLELRIQRHNNGCGKYSSRGIPWELKYYETYSDKSSAMKRGIESKKTKSRYSLEQLIAGDRPD